MKSKTLVVDKVIGYKVELTEVFISSKDALLYALGIGFNMDDQLNKNHLNFTYEMADEFQCFPTMIGPQAIPLNEKVITTHPYIPEYNPMSLLHGEQWTEIIKPIIPDCRYFMESELIDFEDKGSGTVFMIGVNTYNEENELVAKVKSVMFVRDIKGHKYKSNGILKQYSIPNKIPLENFIDKVSVHTRKDQALIYRIGGKDNNPLHVDSQMSSTGGFDIPILHGMCTYGMTCKALYEKFTPEAVNNINYFNARFTSHVLPGETLDMSFYKGNNNRIIVSVRTRERGKQVLIGEALITNPKF